MLCRCLILLSVLIVLSNAEVIRVELNRRILKNSQLQRTEELTKPKNLQSGTQPYGDFNDLLYTAKIGIGTPAQTFEMQMDTGSSNIWVVDKATCLNLDCKGDDRNMFDKAKSSTLKSLNATLYIKYGKGSINGSVYSDAVEITGTGISIKNQDLLLAYWVDDTFGQQPIDGIFGLAWPLAAGGLNAPINGLSAVLDQPLFTVYMKRLGILSKNMIEEGGAITYGAIDTNNCESEISYVNLVMNPRYFWQFNLTGLSIGTYSYGNTIQQAISDTGTSFLLGPQTQVNNIYQQIGAVVDEASGYYGVECDKISKLPSINLKIGGNSFAIPPDQYVLQFNSTDKYCIVAIQSMYMPGGPDWILGDTFIRSYCNIYDIGGQRIGFAKPKAKGNSASLSTLQPFVFVIMFIISIFVKL